MNPMFYFLLALTTVLAATTDAAVPVLDIGGEIIVQGSYYAIPIDAEGGGLILSGRGDKPCPLDIVQESSFVGMGTAIKFSNWKSKVGFVPEAESLDIEMDIAATVCGQSTYWWVDEREENNMRFVTAGPKPEGFGQVSLNSLLHFHIEKSGIIDSYKFVACPRDCTGSGTQCRATCMDVGIFVDEDGVRRLALGSSLSYSFLLMKADFMENSSKTMST